MKLLILLLIVSILLFVVLVVWGSGKTGNKDAKHPEIAANDFNKDRKSGNHSGLESFNKTFGRFSPTLKSNALMPTASTFDLQKQQSYSMVVMRDEKHDFRQAKFLVQPAAAEDQPLCAQVIYKSLNGQGADQKLDNQDSKKIEHRDPPDGFTLTVLNGGGTLTIVRNPAMSLYNGPCKVTLK